MASPSVSNPAPSASSPPAIAPASQLASRQSISIKPSPSQTSPGPNTPTSVTSREWVIPPRPKPGRKPATDTPPTKRKAQNRAAQRAFRERRAARVGELEEHLKQIEDENDAEQNSLRERISVLSTKVEEYRNELNIWATRYEDLNKELQTEKRAREMAMRELTATQQRQQTVPPTANRHSHREHVFQTEDTPMGCGGCSSTSRCECLEAALDVPEEDSAMSPRRVHSNRHHPFDRRIKAEPVEDAMEVDFTNTFTKTQHASRRHSTQAQEAAVSPSSAVADRCGFCQDGTPCICAEMAAADNQPTQETRAERVNTVPSANRLSQFTPPPSDGDVSISLPNPSTRPSNSCVNGAGTCAQCLADPNSTLFCKTLAASRAQSQASNSATPVGCCGGASNGQGCCQSRTLPAPSRRQRDSQTPSSSITLSCADAYTTLSRHPNYERAMTSGEAGSWMPRLYASPSRHLHPPPATSPEHEKTRHDDAMTRGGKYGAHVNATGRPAMEIEVANVMSVLREFDRRFGSNA